MSLNGVSNYGYNYSNPYAVTNANSQAAYQGQQTNTEEKSGSSNLLLGLGAAAAVVGTIYAASKGKNLNKLTESAEKSGFIKNLTTGVKSIFTKAGRAASKAAKENGVASEMLEQLGKGDKIDAGKLTDFITKQVKKANPEATADDIAKKVGEFVKGEGKNATVKTKDLQDYLKSAQKSNSETISNFFTKGAKKTTEEVAEQGAKAGQKVAPKETAKAAESTKDVAKDVSLKNSISGLEKRKQECLDAIQSGDRRTIEQAKTDLAAINKEITQKTNELNSILSAAPAGTVADAAI